MKFIHKEKHGRVIDLLVGEEIDDYGQFVVKVAIDGTTRWQAHFTDKSEQSDAAEWLDK